MAAPNIVNVTTITGKTTYAALTTTLTPVLLANAVSSGKVFKINSIMVANVDGTNAADVTVDINTAAAGSGTSYALASTISVPADATLNLVDKNSSFYLEEDKSILGGASANSDLEIVISYEEINQQEVPAMSNGGIIGPVNDPIVSVASTTTAQSFTSSGTYTSGPQAKLIDFISVAGGGGGGSNGGAGGAGGLVSGINSIISVATAYPIVIGGGGAASTSPGTYKSGSNGSDSTFTGQTTAVGGGFGGGADGNGTGLGGPGGSGGGNGWGLSNPGVAPTGTSGQGNSGGGGGPDGTLGGSGGGAGGAGVSGTLTPGGILGANGGVGLSFTLASPSPTFYAGGGASGGQTSSPTNPTGGSGGGGAGGFSPSAAGGAGSANTGGGGGGGGGANGLGGAGGSGIVIVKELSKTVAPGVWSLQEQYNLKKNNQWSS